MALPAWVGDVSGAASALGALGGLFGGGGDSGIPWQQQRAQDYGFYNLQTLNPMMLGLYGNLAAMSGVPEQTLRNYYGGLPASEYTRVLGWTPSALYPEVRGKYPGDAGKVGGQPMTWAQMAGQAAAGGTPTQNTASPQTSWWGNPTTGTGIQPTAPTTAGQQAATPGAAQVPTQTDQNMTLGNDVWSQSYMASVYNQATPAINREASALADRLIQQGWTPEQANTVAMNWAGEQKTKLKLQAASGLPQFYRDTTLAALGLGMPQYTSAPSLSEQTYANQVAGQGSSEFYSALGNLAAALGARNAQKTQAGSTYSNPMAYAGQMGGSSIPGPGFYNIFGPLNS